MTDQEQAIGSEAAPDKKLISCRRTGQRYNLEVCPRCPYCFGDEKDISHTDPTEFCDFHPGRDPVHFGFPGDDARTRRG